MNNKTATIVYKFFNSTVKSSDFKYKWAIVRYKTSNLNKVYEELAKLGMIDDFRKVIDGKLKMNGRRANEIRAKCNELEVKFTSKHYTWCLKRQSPEVDAVCEAIVARGKRSYAKIQKTDNYLIMQKKARDEWKMRRKFSSLAAMQKWVDKNNIGIDVYKLWESTTSKAK